MPRPNVILIVVDSLREDHSSGLDALLDMGFVKYGNAIAPAPWTLPSHVSMFTGLYPGIHGVHEGYSENGRLDEVSSDGMLRMDDGILGELMDDGYGMYFVTANLFITPQYGFRRYTRHLTASPYLPEALDWDEFSRLNESFWRNGGNYLRTAREFLGMGKGGLLGRAILRALRLELGMDITDKGSSSILRAVGNGLMEREPFMLFVNLMEAHEPYTPRDLSGRLSASASFSAVFKGSVPGDVAEMWRSAYPVHSRYAIDRAIDVVRALGRYMDNSLTIVTSDHGQLLGDGGIGHGYFLRDGLLRVPLYIRWPGWMRAPRQERRYVSLTQIPSIIRSSIGTGSDARDVRIGTDVAAAESFGPISIPAEWISRLPRDALRDAFSHRIRVYVRGGAATYNVSSGRLEEADGVDVGDARDIIWELVDARSSAAGREIPPLDAL